MKKAINATDNMAALLLPFVLGPIVRGFYTEGLTNLVDPRPGTVADAPRPGVSAFTGRNAVDSAWHQDHTDRWPDLNPFQKGVPQNPRQLHFDEGHPQAHILNEGIALSQFVDWDHYGAFLYECHHIPHDALDPWVMQPRRPGPPVISYD